MRIGIVAALDDEARTLQIAPESADNKLNYTVSVCGPGTTNAANSAQRFVAAGVDGLVAWGTAGALAPDIIPGAIVISDTVISHDEQRYDCDPQWVAELMARLDSLNPEIGVGFTARDPLRNSIEKSDAAIKYGARIVDMESSAVAEQAKSAGVPFVAIRAIADPAHFDIPSCALRALAHGGQPRVLPVLKGLARHPQELPALLRLSRWYRKSLDTLRIAAHVLHPTFGLD
jgi:adenosylhomocysteine nucleosidase